MAAQRDDDGWETVTDPSEVPAEIRKSLGVAGVRSALGLSSGTGASGKAIPAWAEKKYSPQIETFAGLSSSLNSFKDDFGGNTVTGGVENKLQGLYSGFGTEGQRDWWATFKSNDNQIRNKLFGSALTDTEKAAYEATTIDPSMDPKEIRRNLTTRRGLVQKALQRTTKFLQAQGYNPDAIAALAGEYAPELGATTADPRRDDDQEAAVLQSAGGNGMLPSGAPDQGGSLAFNDELPAQVANPLELRPEQTAAMQALVQSGASADAIIALGRTFGANITQENAGALQRYYSDPANRGVVPTVTVDNTVKPVDAGDGAAGAAARGAANALTLGFMDELGAVGDTIGAGGTYSDNLNRRRGQELHDEQEHGASRLVGQFVGGLPLGGIEFMGARQAARAVGIAAIRQGLGREVAAMQANRAFALRSAMEGAGIGAVYGAGDAEGNLGGRAIGAGIGAATGGVTAGALSLGGGRFARALAARRAARPAAEDAARRAKYEPSDPSRMAALADQQGVTLLPQDIGGPGVGRMTQGAAQTPFGGRVVSDAADRVYDSFRTRVGAVGGGADTLADVGGTIKARSAALAQREATRADETSSAVQQAVGRHDDMTGAGQVVQRGVARFIDETADRANQLYARVPIPNGAEATVGTTRGMLRNLNAGMRSNPELGAMFESPRLQGYLRALTPRTDEQTGEVTHAGTLSWQDLQEFRTRVGDMLDDPRLSDKIAPRQLRALYGALTEDMEATARGQGENALRSWRRANTYYAARMKRVNDTLSMVVGDRRDKTPNEAMAKLQTMLRAGGGDDAASFGRVMRSIPTEDARIVRATIVNDMRGGRQFDAGELSKRWDQLSERGKSALLPQTGLRSIMDDAADRAAASSQDPLARLSSEQAYLGFEKLANNRGDSVEFRRRLANMSPEEASAVRSLFVHRMGLAGAGAQNADGDAFSIAKFLTRWNELTPQAKHTLFGDAEMRNDMTALATLADRVKGSEKLRGHSNTGGIDIANKTGMGLASAVIALATGHPIVAAGLAAPPIYQRLSAEMLTSKAMLKWLARAPKMPNPGAQKAHIAKLGRLASTEPAIANDILQLQSRLQSAFASPLPTQIAAEERFDRRPEPKKRRSSHNPAYQASSSAHDRHFPQ